MVDGEIDGSINGTIFPMARGSKNGAANKGVTQVWGEGGKLPPGELPRFSDALIKVLNFIRFLVLGPCCLVPVPWSLVPGPWSSVLGPWSLSLVLVLGPWSLSLVPGNHVPTTESG